MRTVGSCWQSGLWSALWLLTGAWRGLWLGSGSGALGHLQSTGSSLGSRSFISLLGWRAEERVLLHGNLSQLRLVRHRPFGMISKFLLSGVSSAASRLR